MVEPNKKADDGRRRQWRSHRSQGTPPSPPRPTLSREGETERVWRGIEESQTPCLVNNGTRTPPAQSHCPPASKPGPVAVETAAGRGAEGANAQARTATPASAPRSRQDRGEAPLHPPGPQRGCTPASWGLSVRAARGVRAGCQIPAGRAASQTPAGAESGRRLFQDTCERPGPAWGGGAWESARPPGRPQRGPLKALTLAVFRGL